MVKIDTDGLISIASAAKLRSVSRQAIFDLISRGKLSAIEIDGVKFLRRDEVLNFTISKSGRPKKEK